METRRSVGCGGTSKILAGGDRAIGLVDRLAVWLSDERAPGKVRHEVAALVGQRMLGLARG